MRIPALALLLAWAVAMPAEAQLVTAEPTAAQRCLTLLPEAPADAPVYPFREFKNGTPGRVLVELRFTGADLRPAVEIVETEGDLNFADAVRDHVRHLRVPCLEPREGASLLRLNFVFQPDQEKVAMPVGVDPHAPLREAQRKCVVHQSGDDRPDYPDFEKGLWGRVVAQLRFEAPDRPPIAQVHARPSARRLQQEIESWVQGLRMPCHSGEPNEYSITYIYVLERGAYGWKPNVGFAQLLPGIPLEQRRRAPLSTEAMGCPFAVEFALRQPQLPNHAAQLGEWRTERQPVIDWLRDIHLTGDKLFLDRVYGDTLRFDIPCYTIPSTSSANKE
ncbi:MAG: hypothetical protein KBC73_24540 [Burkholderiaceae bacterium]|nr:hypothetical protein [Burkholderiaceae bacterium]